jgi:single-stranded DNA-binding protein
MFVLISGTLWRDPAARQSKAGKQFTTALLKAGTPAEALWVNVVCFDQLAQSELLRLTAGDAVSVQGPAKISVFEKAGEHRASLEIVAAQVLALRQPKSAKKSRAQPETSAPATALEYGDAIPF